MLEVDSLVARLHAVTSTNRRTWLTVLLTCLGIYLLTAHWRVGQVDDSVGAAWPGYALRTHGSLFLDGTGAMPSVAIGTAPNGHLVAMRTPGVILTGVPVQLLFGWTGLDVRQGAALTAAVVTAAAMANLAVLLRGLVAHTLVLPITAVVAFGTSVWTVASAELWPHGPDLLWLTGSLVLLQRGRRWLSGFALAGAVATRPHLAVVAAALGVAELVATRSWRPLMRFGLPAGGAMAASVGWNAWYTGWPLGPYGGHLAAITGGPSLLTSLLGFFFSPGVGLLVFSPVALAAAWCVRPGWKNSPWWVRGAAVGGLLYALAQARLDVFNGGGGFYGGRLLLEPLVLAVPLVAVGYEHARRERAWLAPATRIAAEVSIAIYAIGALLGYYWRGGHKDWDAWYPWVVLHTAGSAAVPVVLVVACALLLGRRVRLRPLALASAGAGAPAGR